MIIREYLKAFLFEVPRYLWWLSRNDGWIRLCNRLDQLRVDDESRGVAVAAQWSSDLKACGTVPALGRAVMRRALARWPISLIPSPGESPSNPDISFVLAFRGKSRIPALLATIESIFSQKGVTIECIVVEQDANRLLKHLPAGVNYMHLPRPDDPDGWYKSWAYNAGVRMARGEIVICHDADILVPEEYGREVVRIVREKGFDAVSLQRFLFCLDSEATEMTLSARCPCLTRSPERVRQNWQGGTVAIRRDAFFSIGGYDEAFVGWGGEDNEFFDRLSTLRHWRYGYLPFVHLWHPPQPEKLSEQRKRNEALFCARVSTPAVERIDALCERNPDCGVVEGARAVHDGKRPTSEPTLTVSLTFDDGLDEHVDHAAPMLENQGFRGTFFVNISSPSLANRPEAWRSLAMRGHELGNHTIFHPATEMKSWVTEGIALERYTLDRIRHELHVASSVLSMLDGKTERTYAYTCSNPVLGRPGPVKKLLRALHLDRTRLMSWANRFKLIGLGSTERSYQPLLAELFLAARIGGAPELLQEPIPFDRFRVPCIGGDGKSADELIALIEKAKTDRKWLVFMFHGVGGGHHLSIDRAELVRFLSHLAADDQIQVRTFMEAANRFYYCGD